MTLNPYRFISEGISVGSKQSGLRSKEGPRHTTSCRCRLLLQLAFQRGHLVENIKRECGRGGETESEGKGERERWEGGKKGEMEG